MTSERVRRAAGPAVVLVLAALALAPVLLARGFVLVADMAFVPEQPWSPAWLGLDGSVPRLVPADAFVSVLGAVVPGDMLQKAVLLAALVLAGLGMQRFARTLLPGDGVLAPLGAGVLYLWNPWVLERLVIGHWGLLLGYAALPWVARAALAVRADPALPACAGLVVALALASFSSPTGAVLAGLVALVLVADHARPQIGASVLGAVVVLNLPWLLPGILADASTSDPTGVAAFAASADTPYGVLGSVLGFGGIWKASAVPDERDSALLAGLAVLLTLVGLLFLILRWRRRTEHDPAGRLLALGASGLVLAVLPSWGPGADMVAWMVEHLAGAGILRDSQKWSALLALAACAGFALALEAAGSALHRAGWPRRSILAVAALFPVVLLPSLAWGAAERLEPVSYPDDWSQVRAVLEGAPEQGRRIVALPFSTYQAYPWNEGRAVLDPAQRFFPGEVVRNDTLDLGDRVVAGEDPVAARIADAVRRGAPLEPVLAASSVRYVVVERTAAGAAKLDLDAIARWGRILYDGPELLLVDTGAGRVTPTAGHAAVVVAGDVAAFGAATGAVLFLTVRRIRGKKDKTG